RGAMDECGLPKGRRADPHGARSPSSDGCKKGVRSELVADAERGRGLMPVGMNRIADIAEIVILAAEIGITNLGSAGPMGSECLFDTRAGGKTDMGVAV